MEFRTERDAFEHVTTAKIGTCSAEATDTFIVKLRAELYGWIAQCDAALAARIDRANRRVHDEDENDDDPPFTDALGYARGRDY